MGRGASLFPGTNIANRKNINCHAPNLACTNLCSDFKFDIFLDQKSLKSINLHRFSRMGKFYFALQLYDNPALKKLDIVSSSKKIPNFHALRFVINYK